jgi:hypothetical protein
MALTDTAIRNAKPGKNPIKLYDSGNMYLLVTGAGKKWWRIDYRFAGKRQTLSLGTYPAVSLKEARKERDKIRDQLAAGIDPSIHRKIQKSTQAIRNANGFEAVAREWYAKHAPSMGHNPCGQDHSASGKGYFSLVGYAPNR